MFNIVSTILLIILIVIIIFLIFLTQKKGKGNSNSDVLMDRLNQLAGQNEELRKTIDGKLSETHNATQNQFSKSTGVMQDVTKQANKLMSDIHRQSQKVISEVSEKLTKLDETNKQVVNFSSQLQNLQNILKNPKQRGILGEYFLEETLKNVLPPKNFQMQYSFKDGSIVDAVVFVKDKIIPIDSKFSLENYEKIINAKDKESIDKYTKQFKNDLKSRIDETSKYVKPGENTMDFAFMFIPSESIYYDLLIGKVGGTNNINSRDLIDYAFKEKHVIIVSPTNFLAYLQTVLQGLRALQIEESAKDIRKNVEKLRRHILSYDDFLKKMGNSLGTTVGHYNNACKEFKKVDKDVSRITEQDASIEVKELDRPKEN